MPVDLTGVDLGSLELTSNRLLLRPFALDDVPAVAAACADPESRRWLSQLPAPYTEDDARTFVTDLSRREPAAGTGLSAAVVAAGAHPERGGLVGAVGISGLDAVAGSEMGYWVAPWARGHGYAAEATDAVARWAFGRGLHRVYLFAAVGNVASRRTAERAGFVREGLLRRSHADRDGTFKDMVLYARLADDPPPAMLRG